MERVFIKKVNVYKYSPNNFCIKAFTSNGKEADTNVPIESIHVNKDTMSLTERGKCDINSNN